uniref:Peptidase S1 domain-containing protein n=1 Tax=Equus asinus TaxID=9793 RepID=A0A8C4MG76_EQUAS
HRPSLLLSPFPRGKIIGGHEVKPHSRPYMAFVRYLIKEKRKNCGGVLVRQDIVLTAAHCWGRQLIPPETPTGTSAQGLQPR